MTKTNYIFILIIIFSLFGCHQSGKQALKFYERGNSEMKSGNLINAILYYNKAINLDSSRADIYMARANAKLTAVDYQGATSDLAKVIQLDPNRAEAYLLRAMIKIYKKEFTDDVVADLNKAIQLNPTLAKAYYYLGVISFVRNDLDGACNYWRKAADLGYEQAHLYLKRHCNRQ